MTNEYAAVGTVPRGAERLVRRREDGLAGAISVSQILLWQAGRDEAHGYHETSSRPLMDWRGVLLRTGIGAAELCGPAQAARSAMKMRTAGFGFARSLPYPCSCVCADLEWMRKTSQHTPAVHTERSIPWNTEWSVRAK